MLSYPLDVFCSNSLRKDVFIKLARKFREMILKWEEYRPIRSRMEDLFKLAKNAFSLDRLHRYTKKSVKIKKFVGLNVLLLGMVVSMGIRKKEGATQACLHVGFGSTLKSIILSVFLRNSSQLQPTKLVRMRNLVSQY